MGYRFNLSILGLICVVVYLGFHYRTYWIDYLPRSLSSRLRYYAPISTFEDAAEQGQFK